MSSPLNVRVLGAAEALLKPSGLTLDHVAVLEELAQHEPLSSGEITQALAMAPATVTRCTEKLARMHMVRASLDSRDLRRNVFRLEVRGSAVLFEVRKSMAEVGLLEEALRTRRLLAQLAGRKQGSAATTANGALSASAIRLLLALEAGTLSVGEVARTAALGQSTTSMALAVLVADGLVAREKVSAGDGRAHRYALTRQGRARVAALVSAAEAIDNKVE